MNFTFHLNIQSPGVLKMLEHVFHARQTDHETETVVFIVIACECRTRASQRSIIGHEVPMICVRYFCRLILPLESIQMPNGSECPILLLQKIYQHKILILLKPEGGVFHLPTKLFIFQVTQSKFCIEVDKVKTCH